MQMTILKLFRKICHGKSSSWDPMSGYTHNETNRILCLNVRRHPWDRSKVSEYFMAIESYWTEVSLTAFMS